MKAKGVGAIYPRKGKGHSVFDAVIPLGKDPATGKYRQEWRRGFATKAEAQSWIDGKLAEVRKGGYKKPDGKLTVEVFLKQWLSEYADVQVRAKTAQEYRQKLESHVIPRLGHITLAALDADHIRKMEADLLKNGRMDGTGPLSARTVLHVHRILSDALNYAVKSKKVAYNVALGVDAPRPRQRDMAVLDGDGINLVLDDLENGEWFAPIYLDAYTGLRRSELLGLRWRDVDLVLGSVSIVQGLHELKGGELVFEAPKSNKGRRSVALSPSSVLVLKAHREREEAIRTLTPDSLVFAHPDGSPVRPGTLTRVWTRLRHRLGFDGVRLHDLRHTHATLMLKAGIHPKIVSERLGHSNISITLDTYSHVVPGLQEAAALRFEEGLARPEKAPAEAIR